jgi:hypothetical protein
MWYTYNAAHVMKGSVFTCSCLSDLMFCINVGYPVAQGDALPCIRAARVVPASVDAAMKFEYTRKWGMIIHLKLGTWIR